MQLSTLTFLSCTLLALVPSTLGALYPTLPVQSTTIEAGKDTVIRWRDDNNSPHLNELGPVRIDLYYETDKHLVSTLAVGINPEDRAAKVRIEKWFGADSNEFYIRFTPEDESVAPIYSGKFTVTGLTGFPEYHQGKPGSAWSTSSTSSTSNDNTNGGNDANMDWKSNSETDSSVADAYNQAQQNGVSSSSSSFSNSKDNTEKVDEAALDISSLSALPSSLPLTTRSIPTPTQTYPFASQSFTAASTYTPPASRGSANARFQRPSAGSGLGGGLSLYLIWPFLMGLVLAF